MCYSVMIEQDLRKIAQIFAAKINEQAFSRLNHNHEEAPKSFKLPSSEGRIYPNTWSPIILSNRGQNIVVPMRYRIRPKGSAAEVPSKFNMFNCRSDSLSSRQTWRKLFMRQHGIIVLKGFYEWVVEKSTQKKQVVFFSAQGENSLYAPVLWDEWRPSLDSEKGRDTSIIKSFAIVTREPTPEILAAGHDRSPAFLDRSAALKWLIPGHITEKEAYQILDQGLSPTFEVIAAQA